MLSPGVDLVAVATRAAEMVVGKSVASGVQNSSKYSRCSQSVTPLT
jgi:hypothetical protein